MPASFEEYSSLRAEILAYQARRESILTLAITVSVALLAASVELRNSLLSLAPLLLLFAARVQADQTRQDIRQVATYIRVIHEEGKKEAKWEIVNHRFRRRKQLKQVNPTTIEEPKWFRDIQSLSPTITMLFILGIIAAITAIFLGWSNCGSGVDGFPNVLSQVTLMRFWGQCGIELAPSVVALIVWPALWNLYGRTWLPSRLIEYEDLFEAFLREEIHRESAHAPENTGEESVSN